jgi:type IV pilus assembly protein PilQ
MRTFLRITAFCCFAIVGVGLALCVGLSSTRPPEGPGTEPPAESIRQAGLLPEEAFSQPPVGDSDMAGGRPTWPVPPGPVPADPYPARAEQFLPGTDESGLRQVFDYVRQQIGPDPIESAAEVTPALPPAEAGRQSPAVAAVPADSGSPPPKTSIDEEGDGSLAIRIQDADIREVLELLGEEGNLNILAGKNVQGKISAVLRGVDIDGALGAILKSTGLVARREGKFVFVGTPADFDSIEQTADKISTRVHRPNYVTAAELRDLIQPLLTPSVGVVSVSSASKVGIESDDSTAGGDNFAGGDVVVVRDYQAVLAQIDQVVEEIDVRPMQVAIEAMILSVKLDDGDDFGVNFELLRDKGNVKFGLGAPESSLGSVKFEDGGLKFGFLDSSLGAFLNALESVGETNVIATPRVMVLNKHRAEIQIGEEKGYVSTTITETSSSQSVEFLKLGAQLRLRPFISSDGLIRMEIHPELSDGSVDTSSGFTLPNKEVTQVTTNIMVRDGCTVVIGVLMREQLSNTTTQVPLLGSLPLVGVAFRNKEETTERRELLVLITPRIVYEPETCCEGDRAASEFHRRQAVFADEMSPIGKRSIARKYFHMAQNAWAAGDREMALRYAELSVHFDPVNRAAIDLRSDIWLGRQYGEHTLDADAVVGVPLSPVDGETIPGWLLDDLERGPPPQPVPLHPLDPGQPGTQRDIVRPGRLQ